MADGKWGSRFQVLDARRSRHLDRCRLCAELTIPSLLPKQSTNENDPMPSPYQSLGARAVNHLAAKLLLTLFPPNTSYFRLSPDVMTMERLKVEMGEKDFNTKVEKNLRVYETAATKDFEAMAHRTKAFTSLRLLVATGNTLLEQLPDGKLKTYRLDKYVIRRSPDGTVREIIIKEMIDQADVPEQVKAAPTYKAPSGSTESETPLYTFAILKDDKWEYGQEVSGVEITDSSGTAPKDKLHLLPLTWTRNDGESYGRGHVEENLGDMVAYDSLSKSLLEGAAACAYLLLLVAPNSSTKIQDLQNAPNGSYRYGNAADITAFKVDKFADFRVAFEQANRIEERMARAFLLTESVQRQAERVTAEEIRLVAQELESALGGIYSVLSVEFQQPLAHMHMRNMKKRGRVPSLPSDVDLSITTGFDALGRGNDLAKLREFRNEIVALSQALGKADLGADYISISEYLMRAATSLGIDTDGLVPEPEQIAAKKQQEEMFAKLMELMKSGPVNELVKGQMAGGVEGAPMPEGV